MSGPDKHSLHVFYSSRELADAAHAWFAADGVKAPHPGDALGRCFDCMWAGKSSCPHVGVKVPEPTLLQRAYEVGWVQCATWAERDDLITDCDSGAYTRERDAALAKLTAGVKAGEPADPCPQCERGGVCKTPTCGRLQSSELMRLYGIGAAGVTAPFEWHVCPRHDFDTVDDPKVGCPKCNAERAARGVAAAPAPGMRVTEDTEAAFQRGKRAGYSEGFRAGRDGVMACDTVELTRLADAFERSADWLDKGVLTGSRRTHPLVGTADYRKAAEALRAAAGVTVLDDQVKPRSPK